MELSMHDAEGRDAFPRIGVQGGVRASTSFGLESILECIAIWLAIQ